MDPLLLSIVFVLIGVLIFFKSSSQNEEIAKALEKIPGPQKYPIFGTNFKFLLLSREGIFNTITQRVNTYGGLYRTWFGPIASVHLCKPEYVEAVLNNSVHITKGAVYDFVRPWLLEGLLTSTGARWHKNRKLITPTFHFRILENFIVIFDEKARKLVKHLRSKVGANGGGAGGPLDVYPDITRCALDIICETAMGVEVNAMDKPNSDYVAAVYGAIKVTLERAFRPWLHSDFIFNNSSRGKEFQHYLDILHGFTWKVIQERKAKLAESENKNRKAQEDDEVGVKKRKAFLDMLLEASEGGSKMSDLDIRQEVDTFMFEGHDTTTTGICWTVFLLGNHPEIQQKAFEEQQAIFQGDDRCVTMKDLGEMKYLERIIKEALRLYPSVPFISRVLSEDIVLDGVRVPKGVSVVIQIYHMHRLPELYPDPDRFDPDRFSPENSQNRHPYAYVPFSAGPRNCIGQKFALHEEKTVLSHLIRNFKIRSIHKQSDIGLESGLILRPKQGVQVILEERK